MSSQMPGEYTWAVPLYVATAPGYPAYVVHHSWCDDIRSFASEPLALEYMNEVSPPKPVLNFS